MPAPRASRSRAPASGARRPAAGPRRIELPAALDATSVLALRDTLLAARGGALELNAAGVRKLGGQGAQLLLAAARAWRSDGASLVLVEPSPAFAEGLRLLGLEAADLTSAPTSGEA